jgi:hypothetical protein
MRARLRPPLWFELLVALLGALAIAWVAAHFPPAPHHADDGAPEVRQAWFAALFFVAELIWNGLQAVGQAVLVALTWSVNALWILVRAAGNAILEVGKDAIKAFRGAWKFMRALYDDVLKPAWQKFWKFVEWARHSLERIFTPIVKWLQRVRAELLKFYDKWVRPILDTIDLTRKALHILAKLHIEWAAKLDAKLGAVEDWIYEKFAEVMGKVNEAMNVVNRVVTADGLFQRLALVKSIERDAVYVYNELYNLRAHPVTGGEMKLLVDKNKLPTLSETAAQFIEYSERRSGPMAEWVARVSAETLALPPLRP